MNTSELSTINPFFVMEILEEAQQLEKKGMKIVHLEIGEPIEKVNHKIISFAKKALDRNKDKYTNSLGLIELRLLISKYYKNNFNLSIDPNRIILTLGSSGAIILSILSSTNYGDEIIIVKPHYPCYPQIIKILGRKVKFFETFEKDNYQINFKKLSNSITKKTKAIFPTFITTPKDIYLIQLQLYRSYLNYHKNNAPSYYCYSSFKFHVVYVVLQMFMKENKLR